MLYWKMINITYVFWKNNIFVAVETIYIDSNKLTCHGVFSVRHVNKQDVN